MGHGESGLIVSLTDAEKRALVEAHEEMTAFGEELARVAWEEAAPDKQLTGSKERVWRAAVHFARAKALYEKLPR